MLTSWRSNPTPDSADLDVGERFESLRRGLTILCFALLALGVVAGGMVVFSDFAVLRDTRTAAETTLAELGPEPEVTPDAHRFALSPWDEAERTVYESHSNLNRAWGRLGGIGLALGIVVFTLTSQRRRLQTAGHVTKATTLMLLLVGVALLASRLLLQTAMPNYAAFGLLDLVVMHLTVCAIMPWSAREATFPFGALLLLWAVTFLVPNATELETLDRVVIVIVSPVVLVPGALLAQWRQRRRAEDAHRIMLAGRVESYGGELSRARIVHDAMFPRPFTGNITFEYEYQPIHEIGGDYVHTNVCPETGRVTFTILDVAGHGLAAALTVNRLFGELERILAENQHAEPAEIVELLNRYIYLTMSRHSLFATGMCIVLEPATGELKWVNAGHPPSLVRRIDGSLDELTTTAMLLGAQEPDLFTAGQESTTMRPGEVVIAYTDGAFEARNVDGDRFGLDRVRDTARFDPPPRSWPKFIAGAVAQHHQGLADDDVLIAALTLRSLRVPDRSEVLGRGMTVAEG